MNGARCPEVGRLGSCHHCSRRGRQLAMASRVVPPSLWLLCFVARVLGGPCCCPRFGRRASSSSRCWASRTPADCSLDGGCCGSRCPGRCNTYFRLCLKEYQAQVDLSGACTFGNLTSPLIGGSSFSLQTHPDRQLLLRLPFPLPMDGECGLTWG
ncbi:uncharacterized protein LOC144134318 [Amblyomma americanum]